MKNKNKKIIYFTLIGIVFIFVVLIIIIGKMNSNSNVYERYIMEIDIEAITLESKNEAYHFVLRDDSLAMEANLSFINTPVYIDGSIIYFLLNGRYKKIESQYNYRNINNVLKKIKLQDGNNVLGKDVINEILKSLFIDLEVTKDSNVNVTLENDKIKYLNLYLRDFYQYKNINIMFSIDELGKDYKIQKPIIYKELTDEIESSKLKILTSS